MRLAMIAFALGAALACAVAPLAAQSNAVKVGIDKAVVAAGQWVIDRPLVMLSVILVLLLILCQIVSPGYLSAERVGTILQFSAPLAFLAAGLVDLSPELGSGRR